VQVLALQHTATMWQHTAAHCSTLNHTATRCNTLHHTAPRCTTLQHAATRCNTLQHAATHCNITPQHTEPFIPRAMTPFLMEM